MRRSCPAGRERFLRATAPAGSSPSAGLVAQAPGSGCSTGAYTCSTTGGSRPPQRGTVSHELSGLNMSFQRTLLDAGGRPSSKRAFTRRRCSSGSTAAATKCVWPRARRSPRIGRYTLRGVLVSVFHLGRGYAARRVRGVGQWASRATGGIVRAAPTTAHVEGGLVSVAWSKPNRSSAVAGLSFNNPPFVVGRRIRWLCRRCR